jgi:hypothetical protein
MGAAYDGAWARRSSGLFDADDAGRDQQQVTVVPAPIWLFMLMVPP